jgi:hypothetical protein
VARVLDAFALAPRFRIILTCDDIREGKPHPEIYLLAAERLGAPFGFAAAAARLSQANLSRLTAIPIQEWTETLESLSMSFFAGERAACPPTLLALIVRPNLRAELREGQHQERDRPLRCALCGTGHSFLHDCPSVCPDCRGLHEPDEYCRVRAGVKALADFQREVRP